MIGQLWVLYYYSSSCRARLVEGSYRTSIARARKAEIWRLSQMGMRKVGGVPSPLFKSFNTISCPALPVRIRLEVYVSPDESAIVY